MPVPSFFRNLLAGFIDRAQTLPAKVPDYVEANVVPAKEKLVLPKIEVEEMSNTTKLNTVPATKS
jgi:hypothetical protein